MSNQQQPQTIGDLVVGLPVGIWVDLPEYGVQVRHWNDPDQVQIVSKAALDQATTDTAPYPAGGEV